MARAATPAWLLIRAGTAPRSSARLRARPAPKRATAINSSNNPNSEPTLSLAASEGAVIENASFDRAQAPTSAAPAAGIRITGTVRSRSGTTSSQATTPSTAAASAPRDWVSRMASTAAPAPG